MTEVLFSMESSYIFGNSHAGDYFGKSCNSISRSRMVCLVTEKIQQQGAYVLSCVSVCYSSEMCYFMSAELGDVTTISPSTQPGFGSLCPSH